MLDTYYRSRAAELRTIIATLPLRSDSRPLDVACGDGCYSTWLAERAGRVAAWIYLDLAVWHGTAAADANRSSFGRADAERQPFIDGSF